MKDQALGASESDSWAGTAASRLRLPERLKLAPTGATNQAEAHADPRGPDAKRQLCSETAPLAHDPRGTKRRDPAMPDHTVHPDDAAAMREPLAGAHGELRQQLSNAIVALFKQYFGRGPTSCRTYLEPNLVMFVLAGGYTPAEQTLFEAGRWYEVRQARIAWQDSMEVRFIDTIEGLTHRTVKAFLSANRQDAELTIELFVLEPETTPA